MIWVFVLFATGLILVLAEFLLPGMIAGTIGTVFIVGSGVLAIVAYPDYATLVIVVELLAVVAAVALGMWLMPRTPFGRRLVLQTSQDPTAGWVAADSDASLQGVEARVSTALRPAGTIIVNGRRIDAVSDGTFIDAGETVRVVEVHGSRVVVERV
jgi:membrane-bound serine protease (ClpP class)